LLARWMTPGANRRPAAAVATSLTMPLPNVSVPGSRRSNDGPARGHRGARRRISGQAPRYLCTLDRSVVDPACLAAELTKHPDHPPSSSSRPAPSDPARLSRPSKAGPAQSALLPGMDARQRNAASPRRSAHRITHSFACSSADKRALGRVKHGRQRCEGRRRRRGTLA